ncbi:MAG: acetyl-CoA C-acyltransferase [Deltaproteobacteria bacterium]|nr:acetyl-CoA C-acyltransferase [Deltaproteobacteria bacterium]
MSRAAYIVDGIRSPFGRYGGGLAGIRADDLAAQVIAALVARTKLPVDRIDDVILGCANQAGEDNRNVARMAALLAGLPVGVPGVTVNRLCGSGLQAIADAARLVANGEADLVLAGGVEQMTRAPLVMSKPGEAWARDQKIFDTTLGWRFVNPKMQEMHGTLAMGETAERVAEKHAVSREAQDRFAAASQARAGKAIASGRIAKELTPITTGLDKKTQQPVQLAADEHPRPETTAEQLAKLKPAFSKAPTASVTAGNASGLNDGAAVVVVASESMVKELGLAPKARYVTGTAAGVEPSLMGLGPIPASKKAFARAGLTATQIDLTELNEAFAAQAIPCIEQLGLDPEKVNVNGGAIAYGHPLGASGARMVLTLLVEMEQQTSARRALASMCIGVGQGIAVILERA